MSVDQNQQVNYHSAITPSNKLSSSSFTRRRSVWVDETPCSDQSPWWNMNNQIQEFPNNINQYLIKPDDMHSYQDGVFKQLSDSMVIDLQLNGNYNIHNNTRQIAFEELETFLVLNGSKIDSSNPVSNCYEQYSEKHLRLSFPLPFCLLNESAEALLTSNKDEIRDVLRNVILHDETNNDIPNERESSNSYFSSQISKGQNSGTPHSLYNQIEFDSKQTKNLPSETQYLKSQQVSQTSPSPNIPPTDEKATKKTRKNSVMKKSLATQFQFHHFHESTPLIIQNSPTPSPTDTKNPFRLHHQDKHNLQTQQTGNSGTLSKWKYK